MRLTSRTKCCSVLPFFVGLLIGGFAAPSFSVAGQGRLVEAVIHGQALEGNLLGDSADRDVTVYLPPGYDEMQERRYPTLYLLHGYTGTNKYWPEIEDTANDLMQLSVEPIIIVMPNAHNTYQGSFYANSPVTGNWEDFIADDLVGYMDHTYRTLPQVSSRGIAGHSMGGYGALRLATRRSDVFGAGYGMSAAVVGIVDRESSDIFRDAAWPPTLRLEGMGQFGGASFASRVQIAIGAAFTPNPDKPPFFADLPFELVGDEVQLAESVWNQWLAQTPYAMIEEFGTELSQLRGLAFDVGSSDGFSHIPPDNRAYSAALTAAGIPHTFEEYDGDHSNRIAERMGSRVLPFFSSQLDTETWPASLPRVQSASPAVLSTTADQPTALRVEVELREPPASTGAFPELNLDLSALGLASEHTLVHDGTGEYALDREIPPLSNGSFEAPVRTEGTEDENYLLFSIRLDVYPATDLAVLDDDMAEGWKMDHQGGANALDFTDAGPILSGGLAAALQVAPESFVGWSMSLRPPEPVNPFGYSVLHLAFHPGIATGNSFSLIIGDETVALMGRNAAAGLAVDLENPTWQEVDIPLAVLGVVDPIEEIRLVGSLEGTLYLDDVHLVTAIPAATTAVVEEAAGLLPGGVSLVQNCPNPFNSSTTIRFSLPQLEMVGLTIYNLAGQEVVTLAQGQREAGTHTLRWDGRDDGGRELASGVYLYRLRAGQQVETRKLLLLR